MQETIFDPYDLAPSNRRRILVVDRDRSIVTSIRQLFVTHPCEVVWAENDFATAQIAKIHPFRTFNLMVVDACHLLNSQSALMPLIHHTEFQLPIVLTFPWGFDSSPFIAKARSMGLRVFLPKPFSARQFFSAIRQVCPSDWIGNANSKLQQ